MKTPRELLLARHAAVQPKLEALRREFVAEHTNVRTAEATTARPGLLAQFWMELFWSCRRAWLGLAAAWAVILTLNLAAQPTSAPALNLANRYQSSAELRLALGAQYRLRAELLGNGPTEPVARPKPIGPAPRSDAATGPSAA